MKIVVTRNIPGNFLDLLKATKNEVWISPFDRPLTEEELIENAQGADFLLSLLTDHIDGEVLDAIGPNLKLISNYAVGFDNIHIDEATKRGILVTNTTCDEVNEAVAEHTMALILSLTRRIVESDIVTKNGGYKGWEPDIFLGNAILGKTLGIVGMGKIGKMVAKKAHGLGMKVLYSQRHPADDAEFCVRCGSLNELLGSSDIISLHAPLTEETRHMMNKDAFAKMRPASYLVNTARGALVNEHDLVEVLQSGHVRGAALDVFDNEPDINPELIGMENVILTPHIASATYEARYKMSQLAVAAILDCISGKEPQNLVNPDIWSSRRK